MKNDNLRCTYVITFLVGSWDGSVYQLANWNQIEVYWFSIINLGVDHPNETKPNISMGLGWLGWAWLTLSALGCSSSFYACKLFENAQFSYVIRTRIIISCYMCLTRWGFFNSIIERLLIPKPPFNSSPLCLFWTVWKAMNKIAFDNEVFSVQKLTRDFVCFPLSKLFIDDCSVTLVSFFKWLGTCWGFSFVFSCLLGGEERFVSWIPWVTLLAALHNLILVFVYEKKKNEDKEKERKNQIKSIYIVLLPALCSMSLLFKYGWFLISIIYSLRN